jgi:hypothetical protein
MTPAMQIASIEANDQAERAMQGLLLAFTLAVLNIGIWTIVIVRWFA